jgi:Phage integrase, N-terminal SAM-like domain
MRTIRQPLTPLRQRLCEDMQLRNYSPSTLDSYLRCVADFARHFHASPEHPFRCRLFQGGEIAAKDFVKRAILLVE